MTKTYQPKSKENFQFKYPRNNLVAFFNENGVASAFDDPSDARSYLQEIIAKNYPLAKEHHRNNGRPAYFCLAVVYTRGRKHARKAAEIWEYTIRPGGSLDEASENKSSLFIEGRKSVTKKRASHIRPIVEEERNIRQSMAQSSTSLSLALKRYCTLSHTSIPDFTLYYKSFN